MRSVFVDMHCLGAIRGPVGARAPNGPTCVAIDTSPLGECAAASGRAKRRTPVATRSQQAAPSESVTDLQSDNRINYDGWLGLR